MGGNFWKGFLIALPISLLMWWGIYEVITHSFIMHLFTKSGGQ